MIGINQLRFMSAQPRVAHLIVMFRKVLTTCLVVLVVSTVSARDETMPVTLIDFSVAGPNGFHGILALSKSPLRDNEVLRFEQAIRVFAYRRDSLPRDLNACFFIDNRRYGLTRVDKKSDGSYVLELQHMVDAGVSYRFVVGPNGTVSGGGGFWGGVGVDTTQDLENKITGTYRFARNIVDCTDRFPRAEHNKRVERSRIASSVSKGGSR